MRRRFWSFTILIAMVLAGCSPAAGTASRGQPEAAPPAGSSRALVMAVCYEVVGLAAKRLEAAASEWTKRPFNAALAVVDGNGTRQPYLAESLPRLDTDSWKVSADGRMETTYLLKPNLTWHDGQPLTADDFVFAQEIYSARGLGAFSSTPQDQIDEIVAADARTIVIRWKDLYGEAGALVNGMGERDQQIVQMMRVATDQLPAIMVHFNPNATAFRAPLRGPEVGSPETLPNWNMTDWTLG